MKLVAVLLAVLLAVVSSCSASDPLTGSTYFQDIEVNSINNTAVAKPAYGQFWNDEAASTTTVITAGTYYLVTGWTAGLSYLTTLNVASSNISINSAGFYLVSFNVGAANSGANRTIHVAVFLNNVEQTNLDMESKTGASGDTVSLGTTGLLYLAQNDVVDLRVTSSINADTVTFRHASLTLSRLR